MGPGDRIHYLRLLAEHSARHGCDVHAYVLMTNHVHLLATPTEEFGISWMMKEVNQRYVQDFNRANRRTGTLWEGRFHSSVIESTQYLFACQRYIELNPVRARMVDHPRDYEWSSYRANADGAVSDVITPHALYAALGPTKDARRRVYQDLFGTPLGAEELVAIREAITGGRALGSQNHSWALNTSVGMSPARLRVRRPRLQNAADD